MTQIKYNVKNDELVNSTASQQFRTYTRQEVSTHDNIGDAWIIIDDKVYRITSFFGEHPGGTDVLLSVAGKDATANFHEIQHTFIADELRDSFLMGELPHEERSSLKDKRLNELSSARMIMFEQAPLEKFSQANLRKNYTKITVMFLAAVLMAFAYPWIFG